MSTTEFVLSCLKHWEILTLRHSSIDRGPTVVICPISTRVVTQDELTIQDYSSEWFCCSPYSCVNILCWPLRPGLSYIVKIYMKPNWKNNFLFLGVGSLRFFFLQAQQSSWREDNSEEIIYWSERELGRVCSPVHWSRVHVATLPPPKTSDPYMEMWLSHVGNQVVS